MAITIYDSLVDDNNVEYTFNVNSNWVNLWGGYSESDRGFPLSNYTSNNTSPFSINQPFTNYSDANVYFSYGGHTLRYRFQSGTIIIYLDNTQIHIAGLAANQNNAQISAWFSKDENGIVAINSIYVGEGWYSIYCVVNGTVFDANTSAIIDSILSNSHPITYTWQSVPSISGKNGILNLSQIANVNNGESVTGASASAFTSLTAQVSTMVTDDSAMSGADAGGISGSGSNSGNQSSGYAFGQGESGTNVSGGGSGYYGGEKGGSLLSGGAGSGYIGNSLVSNKKMVGYNVPTSSAEGTKTESVSVYSATKEANKPKAGNGFARVKFLGVINDYSLIIDGNYNQNVVKQGVDITTNREIYAQSGVGSVSIGTINEYLANYIGSNKSLCGRTSNAASGDNVLYYLNNGVFIRRNSDLNWMSCITCIPIKRLNRPTKLTYLHKANRVTGGQYDLYSVWLGYIDSNGLIRACSDSTDLPCNTSDSYKTETINILDAEYCDYVVLWGASGQEDIKDIVISAL